MALPMDFSHLAAHCFSSSYAQARQRFLAAAQAAGASVESFPLDAAGIDGETLAIDAALIKPAHARGILVLTSATHGAEGFCGSGCQLALLTDEALLARAAHTGVALLLIHALNPYGFSWLSRTNEDNIDLNRNAQPFDGTPLPANPSYAELHSLLVPPTWPPTDQNRQAIADFIAQHGLVHYRDAASRGQYTHADGIFYGGVAPSRSIRVLEHLLRTHVAEFGAVGWIDYHTGLGPTGHGEKIYTGGRDDAAVARAQRWWGHDVTVPFAGTASSADITGLIGGLLRTICPDARKTAVALEYGTVPFEPMVDALRGDVWLRNHPDAAPTLAARIRQTMRDTFHSDHPLWHGLLLGQSRMAIHQAINGLAAEAETEHDT